jgi:putative NADH-flavin reductase
VRTPIAGALPRADLAAFLLDTVESGSHLHERVTVAL